MLRLVGWLYGRIINIRNLLYDRGIFKSHSLGTRTISIGNITTGGTGKTPLVAYVAEILADAGEKVCILTRGYGRQSSGRVLVSDGSEVLVDAHEGGDEPVELARKLIGKAVVIADVDRVSAARWAREQFRVTAFVLDDAFQHRRAKRDLDLVCIDATNPSGGDRVLPAGRLREPVGSLSRAHAILITRSDLVDGVGTVIEKVRGVNPNVRIFRAGTRLRSLRPLDSFLTGHPAGEGPATEKNALAFCGVGNPGAFLAMLSNAGITLSRTFPDHHQYTQTDVQQIESEARACRCDKLVTTAKDAVKLDGLVFEMPCLVAEVETVIDDPDGFRDLVLSA